MREMIKVRLVAIAMLTAVAAGPASAFHKETCHGAGCDDPGVGIGTLLDANGDTVGQVVGISGGSGSRAVVSILFEMSGQMFLAEVISSSGIELPGFRIGVTVWFSELGCTGAAWVTPFFEESGDFFGEFRTAIITNGAPDERRLFHVIPGTAISTDVEVKSRMSADCSQSNLTADLFSVTELDSDLHVTFPRPYIL